MTDEKLIELLRKIKEHCFNQEGCGKCVFDTDYGCQIIATANELCEHPAWWSMEEVERIIRL